MRKQKDCVVREGENPREGENQLNTGTSLRPINSQAKSDKTFPQINTQPPETIAWLQDMSNLQGIEPLESTASKLYNGVSLPLIWLVVVEICLVESKTEDQN